MARPKSCSMPYSTFTFYMLFVATFCCGQKERPEKWTDEKEEFEDKETVVASKQNERRFDGKSPAEHGKAQGGSLHNGGKCFMRFYRGILCIR